MRIHHETVMFLFATVLGLALSSRSIQGAEAKSDNEFTKTLFYEFLTTPDPTIKSAIFRKEIFISKVPEDARIQTFLVKRTGGSYLLGILTGTNEESAILYSGLYKGRSWQMLDNNLTLSDPTINPSGTPISAQAGITAMTVNLFLNLGITELVRSSLVWDRENQQLVGNTSDGHQIIIGFEFTDKDRPPLRSVIRNAEGRESAYVDYEYSAGILGGRIPFRFTRHIGSKNEDLGKTFTVDITKIDLSKTINIESAINPLLLFGASTIAFYSNSMIYSLNKNGQSKKVITSSEYQKQMEATTISPVRRTAARIVVYLVFAVSLLALGFFLFKKTNKQN